MRYFSNIAISPVLERLFGSLRKSAKGQPVSEIFKQLFLWRLQMRKPQVVVLSLDTMVMDNDEARKRHGVEPAYIKVNGLQPLQLTWEGLIIEAVFRGGSKPSNDGDSALKMVEHLVRFIRQHYGEEVPIIIRLDAGFFDQELFGGFEKLKIGYICGGRVYEELQTLAEKAESGQWRPYRHRQPVWDYLELGDRPAGGRRPATAVGLRAALVHLLFQLGDGTGH